MTSRDLMPFGKHGPRREGGALTIGEVKSEFPDYVKWLLAQDGFQTKNPTLTKFFTEGETAVSRAAEKAVIDAEGEIMKTATEEFKLFWKNSYGERLRKDGEVLYIAHLRVAHQAWKSAMELCDHIKTIEAHAKPALTTPPAKVRNTNEPATKDVPF